MEVDNKENGGDLWRRRAEKKRKEDKEEKERERR